MKMNGKPVKRFVKISLMNFKTSQIQIDNYAH